MSNKITPKASHAQLLARHADMGREVWITWDSGAEVYELFASDECGDYLGCADTIEEARAIARDHFRELEAE